MSPIINTYYSFDHDAAGAVGELVGESIAGSDKSPDFTLLILPRHFASQGKLCIKTVDHLLAPKNLLGFTVDSLPGMTSTAPQTPASLILNITGVPISIIEDLNQEMNTEGHWITSLKAERLAHKGVDPTGMLFSFSNENFDDHFLTLWNTVFPGSKLILVGAKGQRKTSWGRLGIQDPTPPSALVLLWGASPLKFEPLSPTHQSVIPLGVPMVITKVKGRDLLEVAGRPAALQLMKAATQSIHELAAPDDIPQLSDIALGIPQNPYLFDYGTGDFDICSIVDIDLTSEAITTTDELALGSAVQFMVYTTSISPSTTGEILKRQGIVFSKTQKRDQAALSNQAIVESPPSRLYEGLYRILVDRIKVQHGGFKEAISTSAAAVWHSQDIATRL